MNDRSDWREVQRQYFEEAEVERYRWTTSAPGFAETEDELLETIEPLLESPMLEIGCGEGNNLARLSRRTRCVGVDLFPRKLEFASRELPDCRFTAADGAHLPFADGHFRAVFVRDLLHHTPDPRKVLDEVARVLASGGVFCLLEPNGRNPLVWLQTRLVAAEAGARVFSPRYLEAMLEGLPFEQVEVSARQPLPLRRTLLHYQFGLPALGRSAPLRALLAGSERALGALLPRSRWTYVAITARRS